MSVWIWEIMESTETHSPEYSDQNIDPVGDSYPGPEDDGRSRGLPKIKERASDGELLSHWGVFSLQWFHAKFGSGGAEEEYFLKAVFGGTTNWTWDESDRRGWRKEPSKCDAVLAFSTVKPPQFTFCPLSENGGLLVGWDFCSYKLYLLMRDFSTFPIKSDLNEQKSESSLERESDLRSRVWNRNFEVKIGNV